MKQVEMHLNGIYIIQHKSENLNCHTSQRNRKYLFQWAVIIERHWGFTLLLSGCPCAFYCLDKTDAIQTKTAACVTSVMSLAPLSLTQHSVNVLKWGKKGSMLWMMCWEDSVLMNHISITVSPSDSLKQALTEHCRNWWTVGVGCRQA